MWRDEAVPDVDPTQIAIRTLILHGTADAIEASRQLAWLLPNAELLEFESSGHVPTMTRPDEVVAAIRHRFP